MDGAGNQVRPWELNARARSTRCVAYDVRPKPRLSTTSSDACSLSWRKRAHAIQNSGLNQWIARTISAASCVSQSRRARCAISWASTRLTRSADQESASEGNRITGLIAPQVTSSAGCRVIRMRTADDSPSARRTADLGVDPHRARGRRATAEPQEPAQCPTGVSARLTAAPPIQIVSATLAKLRRVGSVERGWLFRISNSVVVLTSGDAGTTSSKEAYNDGEIVHDGSSRGSPAGRRRK